MRKWIVRLGTLFVFNFVVLLLVELLMDSVKVGVLRLLVASLVLTLATVWIRPALNSLARKQAAKSTAESSRFVRWLVSSLAVFLVALGVWALTVWIAKVQVVGFGAYIWPPLALLLGWFIYDLIADKLEERVGRVYDDADKKLSKD